MKWFAICYVSQITTVALMQYIVRTRVNARRNAILLPRCITYRSREHQTRKAGSKVTAASGEIFPAYLVSI
jgi:hypothetical protein